MDMSTIVAIATGPGKGGIGIIKISGPEAIAIAREIFVPSKSGFATNTKAEKSKSTVNNFPKSHFLYYGNIVDPQNQHMVDEVLLSVMKAPRTYTR